MKLELSTPVTAISPVGVTTASRLKRLGIETVADLIFYFPFRWEDFSAIAPIADLEPKQHVTVQGTIQLIANRRSPVKRKNLTEAVVEDDSGTIKVIWFNQPYITQTLVPGDRVYLSGRVDFDRYTLQLINPVYEKVKKDTTHTARIVPIYPLTNNLTQKQLRFLIKQALVAVSQVKEFLPDAIRTEHELIGLAEALSQLHFPDTQAALDQALYRLKFNEFFLFQLQVLLSRSELRTSVAVPITFHEQETRQLVAGLPFVLTGDQKKAAWKIIADLQQPRPMNRLLEGDVGSGKTIVAALAMYNVALAGSQSVLMAPTEILAAQHYQTIYKLFQPLGITTALLTRSQKLCGMESVSKAALVARIAAGEVAVIVGTHAVIQDGVQFKQLGLGVVDEQHRFGVTQRKALRSQSGDAATTPHLLSMTATPIPRSLALALYGDLDVSILAEKPKDRKPIITKLVAESGRPAAYQFIKDQITNGRQVFVVCPLIDPSDKLGVRSVTVEYEKLKQSVFPEYTIDLLHGKLPAEKKEAVMADFLAGKSHILVSTSVIEVGVDVPNATVMMIEGAERFGLAQLHQFRGRVGRAAYQSYCFLCSEHLGERTQTRLQALVDSQDGFALAELDLTLRGPGMVYGSQQSGWPQFKLAQLSDHQLMVKTKQAAELLLADGSTLRDHPVLQEHVDRLLKELHPE